MIFYAIPHSFEVGICERKLEQVAILLRRLAIGDYIHMIARLFGFSIVTFSETVRGFISDMMMRAFHFIKWPNNEDLGLMKIKFERIRGIPQV